MRRLSQLLCLGALAALSLPLLSCGGSSSAPTSNTPTLAKIEINPGTATIGVAQQVTFTTTMRDSDGALVTGYPLTWASSDSNIVAVNGAGVATGISSGTATVTATGSSGTTTADTITSNGASVTVTAEVASITLSPASAGPISVGGTFQFTAVAKDAHGNTITGIQFAWSSSNAFVATVDGSGLATGNSKGTVTIAANAGNVQSNPATLTVN